ncbi:hypothetical protein F5148DRAFT_423388 [Russula earlei]|uniref:Uncharacterized protein n=1 Tax=Russula earlei TaxID=71964 RepID=A0ACC0UJ91_9AGAM|nr:hypothetical protein F5148DRAFT_423388 [Russula earlei]
MVSSPRVALRLIAFLQNMRLGSVRLRGALKSFILRCLLFFSRVLRNMRNTWALYFQTRLIDRKKTTGDTGGHSSGTLPKQEVYSVVCASRAFEGVGEAGQTHTISRSGDAEEPIPLGTDIGRPPSVLSFSYPPSLQDSPQRSDNPLLTGNAYSSSSSLRAESPVSTMELTISIDRNRSSTPLPYTHTRATLGQFTGVYSHTRSQPPSPSLLRRLFPRSNTLAEPGIDIPTRPPTIQESQASPLVSNRSSLDIAIQSPSRSTTLESQAPYRPRSRLSSLRGQSQTRPARHNTPSADSVSSSVNSPTSRGHSPSLREAHRNTLTHHSREIIQGGHLTPRPPSIRETPEPLLAFPESSISRVSIPISNASVAQPAGQARREMRLMHSEQVSRYVKRGDVQRVESRFQLAAMQVVLRHPKEGQLSEDWVPITHPGGALYFYHKSLRIFTDVYLYNPDLKEEVHAFAKELEKDLQKISKRIPFPTSDYDLVLDILETNDNETIWAYYYVDHTKQTLFWLEPYNMRDLLKPIPGVNEPGHVKHRLESLYWVHWSLYPIGYEGRQFPENASKELMGILLSSSIDSLTSKVSTAPYSVADMQTMRDIIKEAKELDTEKENAYAISSIGKEAHWSRCNVRKCSKPLSLARLLSMCAHWRFVHFHGQKTSRQDRYKTIYTDGSRKPTIFIKLVSLTLFFTPDVHLRELKKVWADELIIEEVWTKFMQKLVSEWEEFVLYSTVILAANVAFLAIQGVVVVPSPDTGWIRASSAQIASSISLMLSIGSIIVGLLLIRRNRTMATQSAGKASKYLNGMRKPFVYLEPLAVIFSLTYALLMWSVCVFFVALLLFSLQDMTTKIRVSVGSVAAVVTVFIICSIANSWDSGEPAIEDYFPEN